MIAKFGIGVSADLKVKAVTLIDARLPDIPSLVVLLRFQGGMAKVCQKIGELFVEFGLKGRGKRGVLIDRFLRKLNVSLGHVKPVLPRGGAPARRPWNF